ncbi:MAG: hypothetical protein ACOCVR_03970, partial [Myxococcota bacterium]
GAGLLVLVAGAVLMRLSKRGAGAAEAVQNDETAAALASMSEVPGEVAELASFASELELEEIIERINRIDVAHLQKVGDATPRLLDSLGSRSFAELMGEFSSGERLLTRAWSAAADNHRAECAASLEKAVEHFREAGSASETIRAELEGGEAGSALEARPAQGTESR